jgi:hypothetical protein
MRLLTDRLWVVGDCTLGRYGSLLAGITDKLKRQALIAGVLFGLTEAVMLAVWGLSFYYGAYLVKAGECTFDGM